MTVIHGEDHHVYKVPPPPRKAKHRRLNEEQWSEIIERILSGEMRKDIAQEFNVSVSCISNQLKERLIRVGRVEGKIRDVNLKKFASDARSILWRLENGKDEKHPLYHGWKNAVDEFKDRHKCSLGAAIIQVCKNYKPLWSLFRKYNVEQFDKYPESHPGITSYQGLRKEEGFIEKIKNECVEQSHRQNLNWAMAAAGEAERTGVPPKSCPNDAAYYLYMQAIESPKEFLARFTAIEAKAGDGDAPTRLASERSIGELDGMLSTILGDPDVTSEAIPEEERGSANEE